MTSRLEIEPDERRAAEEAPPRRRAAVRAALLSLVVAGLVGGSWWAGHGNKPAATDLSAVPVIHPDAAPVKEAPANPGGMIVPDQDSVLLNHNDQPKLEELLPAPEAVKPRPAAAPQASPVPSASPVAAPSPSQPLATAPAPAVPSAAVPSPLGNAAPLPVAGVASAPSAPAPVAAPPSATVPVPTVASPPPLAPTAKATPSPPAAAGSYRLQLGALKTEDAAKQEWLRLQRQQPDVLGKLSLTVSRVDLGDRGIYYRIQAGPIGDAAQAAQSCAALKSRNVGCILVKP